ncbi:uncharacterized protein LOC132886347 [Neoarius graeffei]|uniref:uncharacterized protein LOC132886347 n=1 Tax=Neoarius graeffei TaxID=443677 RepID=UPI00298D2D79|nr:uncharacterized protein LOC132886347 [Neoarius graeffei]
MIFSHSLTVFVFMTVLIGSEGSWDSGNSYNYDISKKSDLTKLYNSKVYEAERLTRPLKGLRFLSHSGVRVTLDDGTKWLVHKGDGFGLSSQTVVVKAEHMSKKWRVEETKNFQGSKTVSDFVRAGGTDYSLLFNNCHHGAKRMMED